MLLGLYLHNNTITILKKNPGKMTCHLGNSAVLGMVIGNFHEQTRNKEGFYKKKSWQND